MYLHETKKEFFLSNNPNIKELVRAGEEDSVSHVIMGNIDEHEIVLLELFVIESERNQGLATEMMNFALSYFENKTILLAPSECFGSDFNRLKNFYSRFGFERFDSKLLKKYPQKGN